MIRTVKIMVILGLLALCGTAWCVEPIPNLISHWKFDEGNGTTAYDSVGSNHGTIYGALWTTGQIDGALSFDGVDDYVDLDAHIGEFQGLSTGAISIWISNIGVGLAFFSASDSGDFDSRFTFYRLQDGRIKVRIAQNGISKLYWISNEILPSGWHHFVYTTDSSGHGIYLDGIAMTGSYTVGFPSTNAFFSDVTGLDTLRIGNVVTNGGQEMYFWNGSIDDVRIYDRALSAEEVQQLYQDGSAEAEVIELEIVGPNEVAENFSASYKAIAYYDNDSTKDVTDSADWMVEPSSIASIDGNGLLTTEEIYVPQEDITIYAQYTEGEVIAKTEKEVLIFAICPTGAALQFDGVDDYVDVGDLDGVVGSNPFTITSWVYPILISGSHKGILTKGSGRNSYQNQILIRITSAANFQGIFSDGSTIGNAITSDETIPLNAWTFLVFSWDGTTGPNGMKLYMNGILDKTRQSTVSSIQDIDNPAFIGAYSNAGTPLNYFNGIIDDVRIYNRALSDEEIQANMHARLSGDELGLVGYWDFDEGEGQIAYDLSGNDNHGQLGSTPDADASDPAWVESDAPIGICSPYLLAKRGISRAIGRKIASLEELNAALAEEAVSVDALEELLASGEFGDLKKGDIVTAKQKIHSAIKHEEESKKELEKSIEKLEDALTALGLEYLVDELVQE